MNREQRRKELASRPAERTRDSGLYGATRFYLAKMPNGKPVISTDRMTLSDRTIELMPHELGKYTIIN